MNRTSIVRAAAGALGLILMTTPARGQARPSAAAPDAPPRDTLRLALDEAVRRAVDHNPDLTLVRLGTEAEAARVAQSRSAFTPVFATTLGRSNQTTPPSTFLLGEDGVDVNDWFSSTGVRQRLPWGGGSWSVSWDASRTTTDNPLTSYDPGLQSGLEIGFSQPLLKDRSVDAARHQYRIARRNEQSADLGYRESVVQTVAAVKIAYWTLKAAAANVTVQQRSLDLAEELVRQSRARVDLGETPPLDLVQAQAEVAQRRESVIRATTAAGDAEDRLRRLIMDPDDTGFWEVHLEAVDEPSGGAAVPDAGEAVTAALDGRYDLARARNDLAHAAADVEFFHNQKLPDLRLEMAYRGRGLGGTQLQRTGEFPGVVTGTRHTSFGHVLDQVFSPDYASWSIGFTLAYPLGGSYEDASLAQASVERRQASQRLASLRLQVAETVRQAVRQAGSTGERIDAARAGVTLAEQRLDTEQRRYEVGLSTGFLVTQAQRDLVQAQVNLLQATLDHQSALVSLESLQQAPSLAAGERIGLSGAAIVRLPPPAPAGMFGPGSGTGIQ